MHLNRRTHIAFSRFHEFDKYKINVVMSLDD